MRPVLSPISTQGECSPDPGECGCGGHCGAGRSPMETTHPSIQRLAWSLMTTERFRAGSPFWSSALALGIYQRGWSPTSFDDLVALSLLLDAHLDART